MIKINLLLSLLGFMLVSVPFYFHYPTLGIVLALLAMLSLVGMSLRMPSPGPTLEKMYTVGVLSSILLTTGVLGHWNPLVWVGGITALLMLVLIRLEPLPKRFRKDRHGRTTTNEL